MFNDDIHVVLFDNVVNPDTFNDDNNVDELETNKLVKFVLLFKLFIDNVEFVDKLFKLLNIVVDVAFILLIDVVWPFINPKYVVDVAFKLFIDNIEFFDKLFKLLK